MKNMVLMLSMALLVTACGGEESGTPQKDEPSLTTITDSSLAVFNSNAENVNETIVRGILADPKYLMADDNAIAKSVSSSRSSITPQRTEIIPCFNNNGQLALSGSIQEGNIVFATAIEACNVSYDPNILADGLVNVSIKKFPFEITSTGEFSVFNENIAENLLTFENFAFSTSILKTTLFSTVTAAGQTHNVEVTITHTLPIKNTIRLEGAENSWILVEQEFNLSGKQTKCSVTKSNNLTLTDDIICNLVDR
ncbi:hypothetical protein [Veronia pacifica]|uniref:Lipoprotein n=1 Tax=Veronia pacifica TaxID=1080227 RepID=A0A1C3E9I2_9GAMM|nr:hypothetical protein [Veronia pacifica]ODA29905.1 hypothetical protein A8L45_21345 [Veronia pacifica]